MKQRQPWINGMNFLFKKPWKKYNLLLKSCSLSSIQKCISQTLIKHTIFRMSFLLSWIQESEVREKILEWLMHEKTTFKWREER